MKIDSSQLLLSSQHQFSRKKVVNESLLEGFSKPGERWSANNLQQGVSYRRQEVSLYNQHGQFLSATQSPQFKPPSFISNSLANLSSRTASSTHLPAGDIAAAKINSTDDASSTDQLDARMQLMITMVEFITGKKVNVLNTNFLDIQSSHTRSEISRSSEAVASSVHGMHYHYSEETIETETTHFSAQAQVVTEDGRTFEIDFEMNMSRTFVERYQVDVAKGAAKLKDPLVINFNGNGANLRNEKLLFDIDADGIEDNISSLSPDSGFLALDKNRDGIINNGAELFGALSGNGFADLAQYDHDGNQFIDEADTIFEFLKVWVKDESGNDHLYTLSEANVGAIYLASTETAFQLKNNTNELLGAVRSSSIYLTEAGEARSIQQLDLKV